jgi:tRNA modification GTPase
VEIFCHGGRVVTQAVVAACREAGAEPAPAGEFTRRAFLNGRLSLDQAEAVADLIHAPSEHAARAAVHQLLGGLDLQLGTVEKPLLELLAGLEGSLEFTSEEEVDIPRGEVLRVLAAAVAALDRLVAMAPAGRLLRDGIQVVLTGPPNVGKSSLFNALLESERAIVDSEPGTTRDVVSGRLTRGGSVFVLHDTAGVRPDAGRVERIGIDRARRQAAEADIVLLLAEAGGAEAGWVADGAQPVIRVRTKRDLCPACAVPPGHVAVSTASGEGLGELWRAIETAVSGFRLEEAVALGVVLNERHLHRLSVCRTDLDSLCREVEISDPGDEIIGTLLASILAGLGEVSGRVFSEQVLDHVFARFCVGK